MRITIPWGGIALIGGTIVLTMTDWPSIVGWVAIVWGVVSLFLHIMAVAALTGVRRMAEKLSPEDLKEMATNGKTYRTNHGRALPVKRQVTNVRGVKSEGNVTIDSKQS